MAPSFDGVNWKKPNNTSSRYSGGMERFRLLGISLIASAILGPITVYLVPNASRFISDHFGSSLGRSWHPYHYNEEFYWMPRGRIQNNALQAFLISIPISGVGIYCLRRAKRLTIEGTN